MGRESTAVRIRAVRRDGTSPREGSSRGTFWHSPSDLGLRSDELEVTTEGKFRREFGQHLRAHLVEMFDSAIRSSEFGDFERAWMHWGQGRGRSDYFGDALTRWIEAREREFAESPALRAARENRVHAQQVCFAVSNVSYSSLVFDLDVGPLDRVVTIFDKNFDSFRVFLEAFVPVAFAEVTTQPFADLHTYTIEDSDDLRERFAAREVVEVPERRVNTTALSSMARNPSSPNMAREKAEWLWRLANGSLLIPVILGLVVMLYAIRELSALQERQQAQLKPILEHHLELLKEDRLRFQEQRVAERAQPRVTQPQTKTPAQTTPSP